MGRPSDYLEEYADLAFNYCLLGATDKDLAGFFDVTEQTINGWKKKHPEFFESIKKAKHEPDAKVVRSLYEKATNGDVTAQIFWLKNRQKDKWRDKQEVEQTGEVKHRHDVSPDLREKLDAIYGKKPGE